MDLEECLLVSESRPGGPGTAGWHLTSRPQVVGLGTQKTLAMGCIHFWLFLVSRENYIKEMQHRLSVISYNKVVINRLRLCVVKVGGRI